MNTFESFYGSILGAYSIAKILQENEESYALYKSFFECVEFHIQGINQSIEEKNNKEKAEDIIDQIVECIKDIVEDEEPEEESEE